MEIDLNSLGFWGEVDVSYKGDVDDCIRDFYKLYQKVLRDYFGFPENRDESISLLKEKSVREKDFFLEVYLTHLETKISASQLSNVKSSDLIVGDLEKYGRLLIRRLNTLDSEKRVYWRPEGYTIPFHKKESNKIWFVLKKYTGKSTKQAKKKRVYERHNEELIIITKKGKFWKLRTSFNTMKEKRVVKKIFSSKKIITCKEEKLKNVIRTVLKKYPISEIFGFFYKDKTKVDYGFSSEMDTINKLSNEELGFLLDNDQELNNVKRIKFELKGKSVGFKIIPHQFNVKHLKLITTGLTPNKIWELSSILSKELNLEDDIYLLDAKDSLIRQKFILNSETIDEIDLAILAQDLNFLQNSKKLVSIGYKNSFKLCLNKVCFHSENKDIFELGDKKCPNCEEKLIKFGSSAKIKRRLLKISEYLISALKKSDFNFKGKIEKAFKRKKVKLFKFASNDKEFFVYLHDGKTNLKKLVEFFDERNYPVLIVLLKNGIGEDIETNSLSVEKVCFPDLFCEYEEKKTLNISDFVKNLYVKQEATSLKLLTESTKILNNFLSQNFNKDILIGNTLQQKGNTFEMLTTRILKGISKSWIELGQIHQNKSVPDGFGYMGYDNKKGTYGCDSKLKLSPNSKGLSSTEIKKQKKYIIDFRKHSRGYGGLKSWIIIIKSIEDYTKFKNSIRKLKRESGFKKIMLLGLEPLMTIGDIYNSSRKEWLANKELFDEFMYDLLKYRGNITSEKIEKILTPLIPKFKDFNIKI